MAGGLFNRLKVWIGNETVKNPDLNNEFNNIINNLIPNKLDDWSATLSQFQETQSPGAVGSEVLPTNLSEELKVLRFMLGAITGESPWYKAPIATIEELTSLIEAVNPVPPNRISSGRIDANNQPMFLVPGGSTPSVSLKAALTHFVAFIQNTQTTFSADLSVSSLQTAPSSQNTCLVNDANLTGNQVSKTAGEFGTVINIDTIGTNITALNGKIAAFSAGSTEYFLAQVDTTNGLLKKCRRGWFFNSSDNAYSRVGLSDNDTLTLMKLTWVFVTNNNSAPALDITYNQPIASATQPTGPAIGDFWLDLTTGVWKKFNGTTYDSQVGILVGICLLDTTNCVAARSFDFFRGFNALQTLQLDYKDSDTLEASEISQKVSVYGTSYLFDYSQPSWSMATNLDSGVTRTNYTTYYFYIADTGVVYISDVAPNDRTSDLLGFYHPSKPWRCLGEAVNGVTQLLSGTIVQYPPDLRATQPFGNFLINSNFNVWQRSTYVPVSNGNSNYTADQWYVKNSLGTTSAILVTRVAGTNPGAKYGASVEILTPPTGSQANGCELYQVIENIDSLLLYGKCACFVVKVKAKGNVNQVGIQFGYATTEVKITNFIGTEVVQSVNTSGFVTIAIPSQYLGTAMTTSGVLGVRIRIVGVSSGNTYDLGNGFIVEQAYVDFAKPLGGITKLTYKQPPTYRPRHIKVSEEIHCCQRYFFRFAGQFSSGPFQTGTTGTRGTVWFPNQMRITPIGSQNGPNGSPNAYYEVNSVGENGSFTGFDDFSANQWGCMVDSGYGGTPNQGAGRMILGNCGSIDFTAEL